MNVARSRRPIIGSGSGSEGAETILTANPPTLTADPPPSTANPSAANPSFSILDSTTPEDVRKTTHKTIHLSSSETRTDNGIRVTTAIKQFSHPSHVALPALAPKRTGDADFFSSKNIEVVHFPAPSLQVGLPTAELTSSSSIVRHIPSYIPNIPIPTNESCRTNIFEFVSCSSASCFFKVI